MGNTSEERALVPSESAALCGTLVNPRSLELSGRSQHIKPNVEELVGSLPIELTMDIFFRMAFKELVSLKCVSKSLWALIGSPYIAKSYIEHSLSSGSNTPFLFIRDFATCYSIEMDKFEKHDSANKVHHHLARGIGIVGSCNGLVCVPSGQNREIFYNPSTREKHEVPPSPIVAPNSTLQGVDNVYHHIKYGFGYDGCGDYKLLKILTFHSSSNGVAFAHSVMIYSLKNNSWKTVESLPEYVDKLESDNGELCNGTLHWVYKPRKGSSVEEKGIIGFNLYSEVWRYIPVPDHVHLSDLSLGTLSECLCLCFHSNEAGANNLYVWVMEKNGTQECWSFLFEIADISRSSITHFRPFAYSQSGDEVLVDFSSTHFLWFDLRLKRIKCYVPCHHSGVVFCPRSIASPKSASLNVKPL